MIFLQIFLLLALLLFLFVVFLENRLFFDFYSPNIWKIRLENILFKYSSGSDGGDFEFSLKFKERKNRDSASPFQTSQEKNYDTEDKRVKSEDKNVREKTKPKKPREPRKDFESPKEKNHDDDRFWEEDETKDGENWFEFAKEIWEKEEKTVKALLKFVVDVVKLSLKLLTPAKIELNLFGGLQDPAETGWLYSSFIIFNSFFEKNKKIALRFIPNFIEPQWKFDGHIMYSFSIARLLLFILAIIFSFPYICAIKCLYRNRKSIWKKNG